MFRSLVCIARVPAGAPETMRGRLPEEIERWLADQPVKAYPSRSCPARPDGFDTTGNGSRPRLQCSSWACSGWRSTTGRSPGNGTSWP